MTAAEPLIPSLVAVMVALPVATACTSPELDTVATVAFELFQLMLRPVRTFPLASLVTAFACVDCPTAMLDEFNVTVTLATGTATTVTAAEPLTPSLVAVTVALPNATACTEPLLETVTMPLLELVQVIVRPVKTLLAASFNTAVACPDEPTLRLEKPRETLTEATGDGAAVAIVTLALPAFPSLVALMTAEPAAIPVTRPDELTEATEGAELDHVTTRSVTTAPVESFTTAVAWVVPPI